MIQLNPSTSVMLFLLPKAKAEGNKTKSCKCTGFNWLLSQYTTCNQLLVIKP